MWERTRHSISTLVVIGAAAVLLVTTVTTLAGPTEAATSIPWVKMGYKDGPIAIPDLVGQVAALPLPAGKYVVSAKLYLSSGDTDGASAYCRLRVGNSWDDSFQVATVGTNMVETMALNAASSLSAPGNVTLRCQDYGDGVTANWIKITAIRAGTLKIVPLD